MIKTSKLKEVLEICEAMLVYPYEVATTPTLAHSLNAQIVIWDGSPENMHSLDIDARLVSRKSIEDSIRMQLSKWKIPHSQHKISLIAAS